MPFRSRRDDHRAAVVVWGRRLRFTQILLIVVMVIALVADVVTQIVLRPSVTWVSFAGAVLTGTGIATAIRFPRVALILFAAGPVVGALAGGQVTALWSISCFAAMLLTVRGAGAVWTGVVLAAANVAAGWISTGALNPQVDPSASVGGFVAVLGATLGAGLRNHARYVEAVEARTDAAETTRQLAVERSVAEERLRIARDLHDGVGHQIAVISVHVAAARARLRTDVDGADTDLAAARTAVKAVLSETQQILHVLRTDTAAGGNGDGLAPVPDHRNIRELVDSFTRTGMSVDATVPLLPELPADRSAALYRIVQETLNNAHKHGTGTVSLTLTVEAAVIRMEAVNVRGTASTPVSDAGGGHGLVGMLERAESVGGALHTSSRDTLFWVHARIPTGATPTSGKSAASPSVHNPSAGFGEGEAL